MENYFIRFKEKLVTALSPHLPGVALTLGPMSRHTWMSYWILIGGEFREDKLNKTVSLLSEGSSICTLDEELVNFFIMMCSENSVKDAYLTSLDPFADVITKHHFTHYLKKRQIDPEEKGQLKLFCSAMDVIDRPDLNVLYVGSGGNSMTRCGKTILSLRNSVASIVAYDPCEVPHKAGKVEYKSEFFLYNNTQDRGKYDRVIDDSYDTMPQKQEDIVQAISINNKIPSSFEGSFVVLDYMKQWVLQPCYAHKEYSHKSPIGGGHIRMIGTTQEIYASSTTYGSYHRYTLKHFLPHIVVSIPQSITAAGKMEKLMKLYPYASISTKWFPGDPVPKGVIKVKQRFYDGVEERLLYNVRPISGIENWGLEMFHNPQLVEDPACGVCQYQKNVASRLKVTVLDVKDMMVDVGAFSCNKMKMKKKKSIMFDIIALAKSWSSVSNVVSILSTRYLISEELAQTMVNVLVSQKRVSKLVNMNEERLILWGSVPQFLVSPNIPLEVLLVKVVQAYPVGRVVGDFTMIFSAKSSSFMYVGDEYVPQASIVLLRNQTISIATKYMSSCWESRIVDGMEVLLSPNYEPTELDTSWSFLQDLDIVSKNDPTLMQSYWLEVKKLSTIRKPPYPAVHREAHVIYFDLGKISYIYEKGKIFRREGTKTSEVKIDRFYESVFSAHQQIMASRHFSASEGRYVNYTL